MLDIKSTTSDHVDFLSLVKKLNSYLAITDGDEHAFYHQYNGLQELDHVVVAYVDQQPVGCGAAKKFTDEAVEIKRMYTSTDYRGRGIAKSVLAAIEHWAALHGYKETVLETGLRQHEAVELYKSAGYHLIPNYGQYKNRDNSVCFSKTITSTPYSIRTVCPQDNMPLAKLIRQIFIEYNAPIEGTVYTDPTTDDLYKLFRQEGSVLFVGEVDGQVVGCGGLYPTTGLPDRCVEFVKFYITPSARGIGLGKSLMEICHTTAAQLGYSSIYIESLPHYAKAISMYEKQGYTTLDSPLGHSGHNGCNIWMLKQLDPR